MPNTTWSKLNSLQLGRYAEYYSKMEFASYGFEIYTSEVDDYGIDFIAKTKSGVFLEIQVKSAFKTKYVFVQKEKLNIEKPTTYLSLLLFEDGKLPDVYLIQATEWKNPNKLLCDKDYEGLKSKLEYGLNISKKNMELLQYYRLEDVIEEIV